MKFAAYHDISIYGIGDTAEEAVAKARSEVQDCDAEFNVASISDDLAIQIERDGWDGSYQTFTIDSNGFIDACSRGELFFFGNSLPFPEGRFEIVRMWPGFENSRAGGDKAADCQLVEAIAGLVRPIVTNPPGKLREVLDHRYQFKLPDTDVATSLRNALEQELHGLLNLKVVERTHRNEESEIRKILRWARYWPIVLLTALGFGLTKSRIEMRSACEARCGNGRPLIFDAFSIGSLVRNARHATMTVLRAGSKRT
jgi:hypothetical protein